jgi:N-hydroxyarylamine O-acetyltransferase
VVDLDAYLARIGLSGRPPLATLHRAHVCSIPFENLDPLTGMPISLEPAALRRKLIDDRRGGYCFEHNLLLMGALEALGAHVDLLLARVRWGVPAGVTPPRTHLVLRVQRHGQTLLADAGFGAGTLLEPIPFGPGEPYEQSGWRFRLIEEEADLVLQTEDQGVWRDVYAFETRPVPRIDVELSNWFTATHPESRFVRGLIVARQAQDGTRISLSDWTGRLVLTVQTADRAEVTEVDREEIPAVLEDRFALGGFALDGAERIVRAPKGECPQDIDAELAGSG